MPTEEMIVLASSRKLGGRCVAGISTASRAWVRPVSGGPSGLNKPQCRVDGRWPQPLDVVRFGYEERCDDPAQPENVLIDGEEWELTARIDREDAYGELAGKLESGSRLFGNRGKAVPEHVAGDGVESSLTLIEPGSVRFALSNEDAKPRAEFTLGGVSYDLGLTDELFREAVLGAGVGTYTVEELGFTAGAHTLLTISLGEVFEGWHHKLVAAVLTLP